MLRQGLTIRQAAEEWVREFNAVPQGMIEKCIESDPDGWNEIEVPAAGNRVYVYDVPDGCSHDGELMSCDEDSEAWTVALDSGEKIQTEADNFDVERAYTLPIWGTMWSFSDPCDVWWLEEQDGLRKMSECGFRIWESEFGYWFGIDGAGYDFYEDHWVPLYKSRGMQWHDPAAEKEAEMLRRGYHKGRLGKDRVWLDQENKVVCEV